MEHTPFLTIFPDCTDLHFLAGGLEKAYVTQVQIHVPEHSMRVSAWFAAMPSPIELTQLENRILQLYALETAEIVADYPRMEQREAGQGSSSSASVQTSGSQTGEVLMGRSIRQQPVSMETLTLESGRVTVEGDVFAVSSRTLQKSGGAVLSFDMTDHTNSIRVTRFLRSDDDQSVLGKITTGSHLIVQGEINYSKYDDDMVLEPRNIARIKLR